MTAAAVVDAGEGMKIRLLGPVDVEAAGRSLDVGPLQRRAVLAALAVDAGHPVSIDSLTERVWGADTPDAPRSALYAHVTRLRHVLAGAGADAPVSLSRHTDGYVLNVDRQRVDLHRIGLLAEEGRGGPSHDDGKRIVALREAMDLWRGPPLSNLASYWAAKVRRSVESQLVGVASAWAAEELRLGNAEVVVDRLAGIVGANPLAEPLVALQMRALCALGRTSEALQSFVVARTQIAEELGTEPGPELRQLHVAVLRGDLDETYPGSLAGPAGAAWHVPRQLPTDVVRFVGRSRELARVQDWLTPSERPGTTPVAGVYGPAGVGKSTLAIHAAHQLADRYPDGQMYLELRGCRAGSTPLSPVDAIACLLRTLGVTIPYSSMHVDEAAALFRSLVAGRRLLLVLDNAADAAQVRPLLPSGTGCGLLVTSRQPLAGLSDVCQVPLGPLALDEAVALLGQWEGAERVCGDPEAAAAIARWCECLPLAVRIAAARLAARPRWPLSEMRDRLADSSRRLDNLELDGVGVRASLAGSYQRFSRSADPADRAVARAFTLLGAADGAELDSVSAAGLLDRSAAYAERTLELLVDAQLLETPVPGRYRMSDLVRLFAREHA
jgi:DNA-binding SARP family transcriptional activator